MSRVLVTGASGFIGRVTVARLARDGHAVRAAVRRKPEPPLPPQAELAEHGDLAQPIDWQPLLDGVDQVVHLAGIAHTGGVEGDLYDRVNRLATAQAAEAAAKAGVKRFVFVSSIRAQSGPAASHVLSERDPPEPTDDYGRSKLAAEAALRNAGVPFTILRPVLLYGPGVKGNFALLMRAANTPLPLPVKSFTSRRSLLGLDNFVAALRFALNSPAAAGETYLVADPGLPPTLADIIATLRRARGRAPLLLPMPSALLEVPLRMAGRGDLWERFGGNLRADSGKLIAAGWQPEHDTRTGLEALARAG
jgi:nucleoside-diphosphate-sugar epimerase